MHVSLLLTCSLYFSYCLVREAKKPTFVRLDQRSNEELKTQTKQLCEVCSICTYICTHAVYTVLLFLWEESWIVCYICPPMGAWTITCCYSIHAYDAVRFTFLWGGGRNYSCTCTYLNSYASYLKLY